METFDWNSFLLNLLTVVAPVLAGAFVIAVKKYKDLWDILVLIVHAIEDAENKTAKAQIKQASKVQGKAEIVDAIVHQIVPEKKG